MTNTEIDALIGHVNEDADLQAIVREFQIRNHMKKAGPRPTKVRDPVIDGAKWLAMPAEDKLSEAEQEAAGWYRHTISEYKLNGWLDDDSEAAILARAQVFYRSLTGGRDIAQEALQRPVESVKDSEATSAPEAKYIPLTRYEQALRAAQGWKGRGKMKLRPIGPPELRKKATVKPQQIQDTDTCRCGTRFLWRTCAEYVLRGAFDLRRV